jgi:hypothetical protein
MKRLLVSLVTLVAIATAAPAFAQISQAENPYLRPAPPLVLGTVVSSTSHSVTVSTVEGEQMTFDIDSRTVMPDELVAGQRVAIEFHATESGRYLSKRISPFIGDWPVVEQRTSIGSRETHAEHTTTAYVDRDRDANVLTDRSGETEVTTRDEGARYDEGMARTASVQPLLGMFGLIALGSGAGLWMVRRRRKA